VLVEQVNNPGEMEEPTSPSMKGGTPPSALKASHIYTPQPPGASASISLTTHLKKTAAEEQSHHNPCQASP
jgi:hypothetical protein